MIKWGGTRYYFHPLFVLLMLLSLFTGYIFELIILFGIVIIHEMGHVVAAKSFGWDIHEVKLLPFGGVAVVNGRGTTPLSEECIVAIAGPLQNGWMIALALFMKNQAILDPLWWDYFIQANLFIALFNLLPILPLDGGRLLLVVMNVLLTHYQALRMTALLSLLVSSGLVLFALWRALNGIVEWNLWLIGFFLLSSNWYSYRHLPYRFMLFLIARLEGMSNRAEEELPAEPIVIYKHNRLDELLRMFKYKKRHMVYICNAVGAVEQVWPEQYMIQRLLSGVQPKSTIGELFP